MSKALTVLDSPIHLTEILKDSLLNSIDNTKLENVAGTVFIDSLDSITGSTTTFKKSFNNALDMLVEANAITSSDAKVIQANVKTLIDNLAANADTLNKTSMNSLISSLDVMKQYDKILSKSGADVANEFLDASSKNSQLYLKHLSNYDSNEMQ